MIADQNYYTCFRCINIIGIMVYMAFICPTNFNNNILQKSQQHNWAHKLDLTYDYFILLFPLVDKHKHMVGSYGPKKELQSYITPSEDAPKGMVARGSYTIKSLFTDDDKNEHLVSAHSLVSSLLFLAHLSG